VNEIDAIRANSHRRDIGIIRKANIQIRKLMARIQEQRKELEELKQKNARE